jgi:Holliday junction DNA helicase RuvB
MSTIERGVIDPQTETGEDNFEKSLRPQNLDQFIGQEKLKDNLKVFLEAAKQRREPLDHALFCAAPGLGKTTLAAIIAREMGVNLRTTSGPILARVGD